ncbi:hypothetical protein [Pseudomonas aeruginosa]|uniref:hypothetical protein n=1 Tax=Pseudomonas aeruginosa TaxID=287 RepID=UPI0020C9D9DC|nr:hypothetical protein [Pseudomonas aeruginosa]MCT5519320.1 hypothetical protein [Pseudomonas aeruginosa]MEE2515675.1 hypothetical protein [Pseudomonas aeruginosa]
MATDPRHFSLRNALADIWLDPGVLSLAHKQLICRCTNRQMGDAPVGEHELEVLHQAVSACSMLNDIGGGAIHWLSEDGARFPGAISRYLHQVAIRLHNYNGNVNNAFLDSLVDFVRLTRSHVATLNYDRLLYSSFIERGVLAGYDGELIDGIARGGFHEDRLERLHGRDFGYYLHLHGSPLFMGRGRDVRKLQRHELYQGMEEYGEHLVLNHVKHKVTTISRSYLLSSYWDYLPLCLSEAREIILFGYSGEDLHLNTVLARFARAKPVRVVEWDGTGDFAERQLFWQHALGRQNAPALVQFHNVTNFRDW